MWDPNDREKDFKNCVMQPSAWFAILSVLMAVQVATAADPACDALAEVKNSAANARASVSVAVASMPVTATGLASLVVAALLALFV